MRVRIVCYEEMGSWILGKFSLKLQEELGKLSIDADIARVPDHSADVNHHVIYIDYDGRRSSLDTVMVTHIDTDWKFRKLKSQLSDAATGICMSSDTMNSLHKAGIPSERLCYISPAHDGLIRPRPLLVGIATRLYPDGRKREGMLVQLAERIDPCKFSFMIMGDGWESIVANLRNRGFAVDYWANYDPVVYRSMIPSLDYYLYLGTDEGSMGFIDALAAAVPTIVTPQGFHLDALDGLVHPFTTAEELFSVFEDIAAGRRKLPDAVADWGWREYAIKHLDLWEYLLSGRRPDTLAYRDGLASLGADASPVSIPVRVRERLKYVGSSARSFLCRCR